MTSDQMAAQSFRQLVAAYAEQVQPRIDQLTVLAAGGGLDEAVELMAEAIQAGAVLQAFGTGHSEAFAMEIAGRAGGLIPTNKIALRDVVLRGGLAVDALGPWGVVTAASPVKRKHGNSAFEVIAARQATMGGGTSEIQRNIIGERILGLPRDPGGTA